MKSVISILVISFLMFSWTVVLADSGERFDTQEFLEERVAIIEPGV
jgi:hypothetical protein